MSSRNNGMDKYEPYATADGLQDLAEPLSITEGAKMTRRFIKKLPDDLVDIDLGDGGGHPK